MAKKIKKAPKGFTLIELVVVVAVIAILAALLVPTILGQAERARVTRAKADVNEIGKAAARMRADTDAIDAACYTVPNLRNPLPPGDTSGNGPDDCLPGALTELPHCVGSGSRPGELCWGGPYLPRAAQGTGDQSFRDPWNNDYQLVYDATEAANGRQGNIVVWSYGLNKTDDRTGPALTVFDCAYAEPTNVDDICAVF